MLREKPTPAMISEWKRVSAEYKDRLKPNRRSGQELVEYLRAHYELIPFKDNNADEVIFGNVTENAHFSEKLPTGESPRPATFYIMRGEKRVFVGIDLVSGMYHIEDDEDIFDELCAFQGLDEADIKNYFLVYEYITCLKKQGRLEEVLRSFKQNAM